MRKKGDLNKWYLAEANFLVKLANEHLQYNHDVDTAIILLQRADQTLAKSHGDSIQQIRQAINQNVNQLQSLPKLDINDVYSKLDTIDNKLDQLPLPVTPLTNNAVQSTEATNDKASFWRSGWQHTVNAFKKLVIVRNINTESLPVVLPEEKKFLYQNLHAQLNFAKWGLLYRNKDVYQSSLAHLQAWVKAYFEQDSEITRSILQQLEELSKLEVSSPTSDLTETIKLFDTNTSSLEPSTTP